MARFNVNRRPNSAAHHARRAGSGRYILLGVIALSSAARADDTLPSGDLVMPTVAVAGQRQTGTSPVAGVAATITGTGTKTDTPLVEVPQAISVITRDQMQQQDVHSVGDSLRYTPGVFADTRIGGVLESVFLRGFGGLAGKATNPQLLDGLPLQSGINWALPVVDPSELERVEVLHGPASVLYGQASPGGVVNLISKQPTSDPLHEVSIETGNRDRLQGSFDVAGSLSKDGTWSYRLNGLARRDDAQTDYGKQQRIVVAPSLSWRPDGDTRLTFLTSYQNDPHNDFAGWLPAQGTVLPNAAGRISTKFFPGEPGYDSYDREQYRLGYAFEHRFNDTWTVRQNFRYSHIDARFEGVALDYTNPFGLTSSSLNRQASWAREHTDGVTLDNRVQADFATGPLQHTLLMGLAYQASAADMTASGYGSIATINYLDPVYGVPFTSPAVAQRTHQTTSQVGLYAQDQIRLGRWAFTLGGRQDWSAIDTHDRLLNTNSSEDDHAFTGRVGAVYLFDNGIAPYASYSTSFEPTSGTDYASKAFKPTKARQEEVGVKYQPTGRTSLITASAFNIDQTNVSSTDPDHPLYYVQTGAARSRGVEIEGRVRLTDHFDVLAAYTYLDTVVTKDTDQSIVGNRLVSVPKHLASLWGNYTFTDGAEAGLSVAGGVRYIGTSAGDQANSFTVPSATVFDAALHYDLGTLHPRMAGWRTALNATNLLDKTYVASCFSAGGCFYGNRRTVTVGLTHSW